MLTAVGKTYSDELFVLNEQFVKHPSNHQLAKEIVYTKDKTPEKICDELVQKLTIDFLWKVRDNARDNAIAVR